MRKNLILVRKFWVKSKASSLFGFFGRRIKRDAKCLQYLALPHRNDHLASVAYTGFSTHRYSLLNEVYSRDSLNLGESQPVSSWDSQRAAWSTVWIHTSFSSTLSTGHYPLIAAWWVCTQGAHLDDVSCWRLALAAQFKSPKFIGSLVKPALVELVDCSGLYRRGRIAHLWRFLGGSKMTNRSDLCSFLKAHICAKSDCESPVWVWLAAYYQV